jgi:hypothetical protein
VTTTPTSGRRLLLLAFVLTLPLVSPKFRGADEIEYFSYLRSAVFDFDLDFTNEYTHFYEHDPQGLQGFKATFLDRREARTGRPINFAPLGSALLWSPVYLLAHAGVVSARALGVDVAADGFSAPYLYAAALASAGCGFAGLLLLHALLRRAAGAADPAAALTVLALGYGSPVLYYLTVAPGFSHAASLFAVALLLWLWLARRGDGFGRWALIGAAGGLAALVREQELLFLAAPGLELLWRALARRDVAGSLARGVVMSASALAAFAPQLLAYRALNGRFGPSTLVQRKMNWASPHFAEVLIDPGHGLFVWCPLLLVATLGLVAAWRRAPTPAGDGAPVPPRLIVAALALALLLQVWINGAVESWSMAGAFGSRRFVSATPVFAWGLAALVGWASARGWRRASVAVVALAVWWNVSLMVQFGLKLMDRQRLEWPRVAVNQVTAVPRLLARTAWLYVVDREALVKETR